MATETRQTGSGTVMAQPTDDSSQPAELIIAMGLGEKSLASRLEECRQQGLSGIPVDELLKYFHDAARAIDYLNTSKHELATGFGSIQHCDIKPSNILIVGDAAQVCDFGLAREVSDSRSTSLALSPVYAAPEMIETNVPSDATDQYSLAVSYLELRTGELPFVPDAGLHTIVQAHLNNQLELSRLPAAEQHVIKRATNRQPTKRYGSTSEMVAALEEACHPRKLRPAGRVGGWRLAASLAAAMVFAAGVSWWIRQPDPLTLPVGFQTVAAAAGEAPPAIVNDLRCPRKILCTLLGTNDELKFMLRLVTSSAGPGSSQRAFYIMESPVSRSLFAEFMKQRDEHEEALGAQVNVSACDAGRFACWLDGKMESPGWSWNLPTAIQWDLATGRGRRVKRRRIKRHRQERRTSRTGRGATSDIPRPPGRQAVPWQSSTCHRRMRTNGAGWPAASENGLARRKAPRIRNSTNANQTGRSFC